MKGKPIYTIISGDIHDGEWKFENGIDGTNLKITPIDNTVFRPSDALCEYFSALRKDMLDNCAFTTTTAKDYIEK